MSRLLFLYDIHYAAPYMRRSDTDPLGLGNGNLSLDVLSHLLNAVKARFGVLKIIAVGGDIADHQLRQDNKTKNEGIYEKNYINYWASVASVFSVVDTTGATCIATTGNHEVLSSNGWYRKAICDNKHEEVLRTASRIVRIGEAWKSDNYRIFCLGASSDMNAPFECEYKIPVRDIETVKKYLENTPPEIPVFILSHYPLHESAQRESPDADGSLRALLRKYPNVIFIWGHNHASGIRRSDPFYDRILTEEEHGKPLGYTYLSGGCMSADYAGDVQGKALLVDISETGGAVYLTYLDQDAYPIGEHIELHFGASDNLR